MKVLITYDISTKHPEVKAAMKKKTYLDCWTNDNKTYYLPNTTLWKNADSINPSSVKADFEKVVADLNANIPIVREKIRIERLVVVEISRWDGITGDEHSE